MIDVFFPNICLHLLLGKILFRRSHIRDVAMKRLGPINEYCRVSERSTFSREISVSAAAIL